MKKLLLFVSLFFVLSVSNAQPIAITTGAVTGSPLCAGTLVSVPFTAYASLFFHFQSQNAFEVEISDEQGIFTIPPRYIGHISATPTTAFSATIPAIIPSTALTGSSYHIRVVSTTPQVYGTNSPSCIEIAGAPTISQTGGTCLGPSTLALSGATDVSQIDWYRDGAKVHTSSSSYTPFIVVNSNQLHDPRSMFVDRADTVYVADNFSGGGGQILKYAPGSTYGTTMAEFGLQSAYGVSVDDDGNIYVTDNYRGLIRKFPSGSNAYTFGTIVAGDSVANGAKGQNLGLGLPWLRSPNGLWVDKGGNKYVADADDGDVIAYPPGSTNGTYGSYAAGYQNPIETGIDDSTARGLYWPMSAFIDAAGNTFVADAGNNRIQKCSPGTISAMTVAGGTGPHSIGKAFNQLNNPTSVYVDSIGNIYVADQGNTRILMFPSCSREGTSASLIAGIQNTGIVANNGIDQTSKLIAVSVDAQGSIYVLDEGHRNIQKYFKISASPLYTPASAGIYDATYTTYGGCTSPASNLVAVNAPFTPSVTITASQTTVCRGASVTFTATPANGCNPPSYQWEVNGQPVGVNSPTYISSSLNNNDVISVVMTCTAPCVSPPTATSNTITLTVTQPVIPAVSIVASQTSSCANTPVTFTATPVNGGTSPNYEWKVDGYTFTNGASPTYTSTSLNNNDIVSVIMTSNAACASPPTATSNSITMTVPLPVIPSVSIIASQTSICANTPVTFTATPVNGGTSPNYEWKVDGYTFTNGASPTYTSTSLNNNDIVSVIMTSNAACSSPPTATSNSITMTVPLPVIPSVSIIASQTSICAGVSVTFTATPINGGTNPIYTWYNNGYVLRSGTSPTYTSTSLNNNAVIYLVLTSNAACAFPPVANSNTITMTVNQPILASVSISTPLTTICSGTPVTFTATPVNGGLSPSYQWYNNGMAIAGATSSVYSTTSLNTGYDIINVSMTGDAICAVPTTSNSNSVIMNVSPTVTPLVSISAPQTSLCSGGPSVQTTAFPVNGGTNPTFSWYLNGVPINNNSTTNGLNPLNTIYADEYVVMTSSDPCASPASATSNHIIFTVTPTITPAVSISASQATICSGVPVTFTAAPINGGTGATFQWYDNGVLIPNATSSSYTSNSLNNNDVISVVMTSTATCANPTTATSNSITISVTQPLTPSVTISASQTTICSGIPVTFTATPINGGTGATYQWYDNGALIPNATSSSYTSNSLNNNDVISVVMTCTATCANQTTATSNSITISVTQPLTPSVTISASQTTICSGIPVTFTATPINGGSGATYQWYDNGVPIPNATSSSYTSNSLNNNDVLSVVMTSTATCANPTTATSNSITISVNSSSVPILTLAGGSELGPASIVLSGAGPGSLIDWYLNGSLVNTTLPTLYTDSTVAGGNGQGPGSNQLYQPQGIFLDGSGNLYVADQYNYRIQKFPGGSNSTTNGVTVAGITGQAGSGALNEFRPSGVYIDTFGYIYVSDAGNNRILKFPQNSTSGTNGVIVAQGYMTANELKAASALFLDRSGNIYVADDGNNNVQMFPAGSTSTTNGTIVAQCPSPNGGSNTLWQIYVDSLGNLYVADNNNNRIQMFPAGGGTATNGITVAGGNGSGSHIVPSGVFVDRRGYIYVSDWGRQQILRFPPGSNSATTGVLLLFGSGTPYDRLDLPRGLFVDDCGNIYLADQGNNRILKFSPGPPYSVYIPTAPGSYTATYTTCDGCTSAVSNAVTVSAPASPSVAIRASRIPICSHKPVTMTAVNTGGGAHPSYQWYKNGAAVGTNSATYKTSLHNSDSVWLVMTVAGNTPGVLSLPISRRNKKGKP